MSDALIIPAGIVGFLVCAYVAYVVVASPIIIPTIVREFRESRRRKAGRCIRCGYDLRGSARAGRCPECGALSAKKGPRDDQV